MINYRFHLKRKTAQKQRLVSATTNATANTEIATATAMATTTERLVFFRAFQIKQLKQIMGIVIVTMRGGDSDLGSSVSSDGSNYNVNNSAFVLALG